MSQLLRTLFGGIYDSRVNFDNIVYDELGVWTPDWVLVFSSVLCYSANGRDLMYCAVARFVVSEFTLVD